MAEEDKVGTGDGGLVVPGDLGVSPVNEAAAPGNGEDPEVDGMAAAAGTGLQGPALPEDLEKSMTEEAAALGNGEDRDWSEIDRHADRVSGALGGVVVREIEKLEGVLSKLQERTEATAGAHFRDMKLHLAGSIGVSGREQAAAAWRGPAEALQLLGGVLAGLSERAGRDAIDREELRDMFPVLKTAEELLLRACQHEEGRLPVIDEALGGTGTHGARAAVVAASVGEAVALVEKMMRGTERPGRRPIAVLVAGAIVQLGGVFGAQGENSEFVQRVERLRQERAGPVEGAESNDVRAFRADFGKEMERLRNGMRWRERGIWAGGAAACLLFGWLVGISGADFSFVGRLL